ncbi:MAG: DUF3034 family protein [Pseudomonadota bacterium]
MRRLALLLCLFAMPALADGRLLGTGGAMTVEGSAGGGIVPWAVLAGYGTEDENGGAFFVTGATFSDYDMVAAGGAWAWRNRVELSYARQDFDISALSEPRGIAPDSRLRQDVFGMKVRLVGDLIYGDVPQVTFGVQYKQLKDFMVPAAAGARDDAGIDYYVSVSRLILDGPFGRQFMLNGTLRTTAANQGGLMGFGGDLGERTLVAEASAALLLNRRFALGAEYRQRPNNLSSAREDDWFDVFGAWFINKRVSVVGAYATIGDVGNLKDQRGAYVSLTASF